MHGTPVQTRATTSRVTWIEPATINGATIDVTWSHTRYGMFVTASAGDTLIAAAFCTTPADYDTWHAALTCRFPQVTPNVATSDTWVTRIFTPDEPVDVIAPDTSFRRVVHTELSAIPTGCTVSYSELARRINRPSATRAVASAVAANTVAVVIPCHRVWRSDGQLGAFRWGSTIKRQLCDDERSRR